MICLVELNNFLLFLLQVRFEVYIDTGTDDFCLSDLDEVIKDGFDNVGNHEIVDMFIDTKPIIIDYEYEAEVINQYSDWVVKPHKEAVIDYLESIISLNGEEELYGNERELLAKLRAIGEVD